MQKNTKRKLAGKKHPGGAEVPDELIVESELLEVSGSGMDMEAEEAAEETAGEVGGKSDRFLPISILVSGVLIGGALVFSSIYKGQGTEVGVGGNVPPAGGAVPAEAMKLGPRDAILGKADAPVTVIEYGDYQCPFCTRFFTQTQSKIVSSYVDTGKVKMVFRNFAFLGPESVAAAAAAECANDQGKLWPYHDAIYQTKADDELRGGGENDGSLNRTLFLKIAQDLNLDVAAFTSCIDGNKYVELVAQEKAAATSAGVNSTPSFLINGKRILGAEPFSTFERVINEALKK